MIAPELRRFIEIVAAERTKGNPDMFDECVQEGMIAAWQALERHPGKTDTYYRAAAKNGVMNPLRGRASFGHESTRGKQDASSVSQSIWGTTEAGDDFLVHEPLVEAPYEAVDVQEEVRRAVSGLSESDRVLVFARYWEDAPWGDVASMVGIRKNRLEWRWMTSIKPALRDALDGLRADQDAA